MKCFQYLCLTVFVMSFILLTSHSASAQLLLSGIPGERVFDFSGGQTVLGTSLAPGLDQSQTFLAGELNVPLHPNWDALAVVGILTYDDTSTAGTRVESDAVYLNLGGNYHFQPEAMIDPFVGIGVGFWTQDTSATTTSIVAKDSETDFLISIRSGFRIKPHEQVDVIPAAIYLNVEGAENFNLGGRVIVWLDGDRDVAKVFGHAGGAVDVLNSSNDVYWLAGLGIRW